MRLLNPSWTDTDARTAKKSSEIAIAGARHYTFTCVSIRRTYIFGSQD